MSKTTLKYAHFSCFLLKVQSLYIIMSLHFESITAFSRWNISKRKIIERKRSEAKLPRFAVNTAMFELNLASWNVVAKKLGFFKMQSKKEHAYTLKIYAFLVWKKENKKQS